MVLKALPRRHGIALVLAKLGTLKGYYVRKFSVFGGGHARQDQP